MQHVTSDMLRAALVIDLIVVAAPLTIIAALLVRRLQWRALAKAADRARIDGVTRSGDKVIYGIVESEDDSPPITVSIDEAGFRHLTGRSAMQWNETARRTIARPFVVRTPAGEHIHVAADEGVLLLRPLDCGVDPTGPSRRHQRTRSTALMPGEAVYVVGVVSSALAASDPYRGNDNTPATMKARRGGQLTVSTMRIAKRYLDQADYLTYKAIGVGIITLFVHCLATPLWKADLAQLNWVAAWLGARDFGEGLESSRLAVVARGALFVASAIFGPYYFAARRPWYDGKLIEIEETKPPSKL